MKICKEEMVAGNRPGTHFNKVGWANLKTKFLKEIGLNYESKQFKNKPVLVGILLKRPYKQENPDVAKFREKGPKHLDEIEFNFFLKML
ncbi:hypothetical protein AHAS_AhasUnG0039800 [Arachis hypogaea]